VVRIVRHFLEGAKKLMGGCEPGGTVLTVTDSLGLDAIQIVNMGCG
jgi:hypothetical protein